MNILQQDSVQEISWDEKVIADPIYQVAVLLKLINWIFCVSHDESSQNVSQKNMV